MALPLMYNINHLRSRWFTATFTLLFVAIVVFVLVATLGIASGMQRSLTAAGDVRNMVVLAKGAQSESTSAIQPTAVTQLEVLPGLHRDPATGRVAVSKELVAVAEARRRQPGDQPQMTTTNIAVRGVDLDEIALTLPRFRLIEGRAFTAGGAKEVLVGKTALQRFENMEIGQRVRVGVRSDDTYTVVGIFEMPGPDGTGSSSYESEVWGYVPYVQASYDRSVFSVVRLRLAENLAADAAALEKAVNVIEEIAGREEINLAAKTELSYFESIGQQSQIYQAFAFIFAMVLGIGAIFAIMNTMYGAVAGRMREIGTLRAVGFSRFSVLSAFLLESLLVSALGGVAGVLVALLALQGTAADSVTANFTAVAYEVDMSPAIIASALLMSLLLGVFGAMIPAWQASQVKIIDALKAVQ